MKVIMDFLSNAVFIVKIISVLVLLLGLITYLKDVFTCLIKKDFKGTKIVKNKLGGVVLLGLEILIIADIVETIINPTFKDIALLAAIVGIRTAISYFLNKEIGEVED